MAQRQEQSAIVRSSNVSAAAGDVTLATLRAEIVNVYLRAGEKAYGLYGINQLEHALQSAKRAEEGGLSSAMVMACLLHDVGHMIHDLGEAPAEHGIDDHHEARGAGWAARRFPRAVSEPIRLHVAAKRYLCTVEEAYIAQLAKDSLISLELQGGLMTAEEIARFLRQDYAGDAILLRRIDELAKDVGASTPSLETFLDRRLAEAVASNSTR